MLHELVVVLIDLFNGLLQLREQAGFLIELFDLSFKRFIQVIEPVEDPLLKDLNFEAELLHNRIEFVAE